MARSIGGRAGARPRPGDPPARAREEVVHNGLSFSPLTGGAGVIGGGRAAVGEGGVVVEAGAGARVGWGCCGEEGLMDPVSAALVLAGKVVDLLLAVYVGMSAETKAAYGEVVVKRVLWWEGVAEKWLPKE